MDPAGAGPGGPVPRQAGPRSRPRGRRTAAGACRPALPGIGPAGADLHRAGSQALVLELAAQVRQAVAQGVLRGRVGTVQLDRDLAVAHVDGDLHGSEVVRVQLQLDGVAPVVARSSGPTAANTWCCTGTGSADGAGAAGADAGAPDSAGTPVVGATCPACTVAAGTDAPAGRGVRARGGRGCRCRGVSPRLRTSARRASPGGPAPAVSRLAARDLAVGHIGRGVVVRGCGSRVVGFAVVPPAAWASAPPWPAVPVAAWTPVLPRPLGAAAARSLPRPCGRGAVTAEAGAPGAAVVIGPGSDRVAVSSLRGPPAAVAAAAERRSQQRPPPLPPQLRPERQPASGAAAGSAVTRRWWSDGRRLRHEAAGGLRSGGSAGRPGGSAGPAPLAWRLPARPAWLWPFAGVWLASTAPKEPCSLPWRRPARGADVASTPRAAGAAVGSGIAVAALMRQLPSWRPGPWSRRPGSRRTAAPRCSG